MYPQAGPQFETKGDDVQLTSWLASVKNRLLRNGRSSRGNLTVRRLNRLGDAERLESRELLTVAATVVQNELFVSSDSGDAITVRAGSITPIRVEILSNGVLLNTLPATLASSLTAITVTGGDGNNTIDVSGVTSSAFSSSLRITVDGGNGNDSIVGSSDLAASLLGGDGADTITGGGANDTIVGGDNNDSILGGLGNDSIRAANGRDFVDGESGNDTIDGGDGKDTLLGDAGTDSLLGGADTDSLLGGVGNDTATGGSGNDTVLGEDGDDSLLGGSNNDSLLGGIGRDVLQGEAGLDSLFGEAGDDSLDGGNDNDSLSGGDDDDLVNGSMGNDTVVGNDGHDSVFGGGGHDRLFGDAADTVNVGNGNDFIKGNGGNDTLTGGGGRDTLRGDAGHDQIGSGDTDSDNTPVIRISDAAPVVEGSAGQQPVTFSVTLQRAFTTTVTVQYTTVSGTAAAGSDFGTAGGLLSFLPGDTSQSITVQVLGDLMQESDEVFFVDLLNPVGAQLGRSRAQAVIQNDDNWISQGPSPTQNGQVENIVPNDEVIGALHAVVAHPTNPDIMYVGGTNGGIWRTNNAMASSPTWVPLTDNQLAQSIGALTMDPADSNRLLAGIGRHSSYFGEGSNLTGLLLTDNGGSTWRQITDPLLVGRNISGVVLRGSLMLASADLFAPGGGLFRSADNGTTWTAISGSGGLPAGPMSDLVGDPSNSTRFYVAVSGIGIFRSDDSGVTWANISANDATTNGVQATITGGPNINTEMAVASNGRLYVAVVLNFGFPNGRQLAYIGYTDNGTNWNRMDLPTTLEFGNTVQGINPTTNSGGQAEIHLSLIVDPTDTNIIYIGGDRQDGDLFGPNGNSIGARDFSARIFRGDTRIVPTGQTPSPQWAHMTHSNGIAAIPTGGTASGSSPHADSRDMTFDANGNLIEVDDGGIYRRTNPRSNTGDWFSMIGTLRVTELHDVAYDTVSNIIFGGAQDTGTPQQIASGSPTWTSVSTADGGDVAVDITSTPGMSVRYSSFQNLGAFRRRTYDAANNLVSQVFPARTVTGNGAAFIPQFVTPVVVNEIDGRRLILGGANNPYESLNQGNTITELNVGAGVNSFLGAPIAYGGRRLGINNPDVLYVGSGSQVFVRQAGTGVPAASAYPGGFVTDIVMDPDDWMTAYAVDVNLNSRVSRVFRTTDAGATWSNVSGNLTETDLHAVEFINGTVDQVVVAGRTGVYRMAVGNPGVWAELDPSLPTVPVWDLDYDSNDDVLVAGTFGRGAWLLNAASLAGTNVIPPPPPPPPPMLAADGDMLLGDVGNDTIFGADGDDFIDGEQGNDSLVGGGGQDTIVTGGGNDTTDGGSSDDEIRGEQGNSNLGGGSGTNVLILEPFASGANTSTLSTDGADLVEIRGTAGNDTFNISQVNGRLRVTTSTASITMAASVRSVTISGGSGNDAVVMSSIDRVKPVAIIVDLGDGNDTFTGTNASVGLVPVQILGRDGNDTAAGSLGNDFFDGGAGNDSLSGADGKDTLKGGLGDDVLSGGKGDDLLQGEDGADFAIGDEDNDRVDGGNGNDILNGSFGNDTVRGENGLDTLFGGAGHDRLEGGSSADSVRGHAGDDLILGGDGDDLLRGDQGADSINGGHGDDNIDSGDGNDLVTGGDGSDLVVGSVGNDTLLGEDGNDSLFGGEGRDIALGGDGDDVVRGNGGSDTVAGGDGTNDLSSNSASEIDETFVLNANLLALLNPL